MTRIATIAGALLATTSLAQAAPLDRTKQSVDDILFADGNYVELSFSRVSPDATGVQTFGVAPGTPGPTSGDVAPGYNNFAFGMKYQLTDAVSLALIYDRPFGVDIAYAQPTFALNGTAADLETQALTGLVKYEFPTNTSVFGGLRYQRLDATADLLLPGVGAYNVTSQTDDAVGYVLGVAYERPEIALRVALTYSSEIEHETGVTETITTAAGTATFPGRTSLSTPQSVNLEAQTGVAPGTLVFGSIRWVDYSEFSIAPPVFGARTGRPLSQYDNDLWFFEIGVGRQITDRLSGAVTAEYVTSEDDVISPLSPSDGRIALGVGGKFDVTESMTIGAGVRYVWLGDAEVGSGGVKIADFKDNHAIAAGMSVGFSF